MVGKSKYKKGLLKLALVSNKRILQQHHLPRKDEIACIEAAETD